MTVKALSIGLKGQWKRGGAPQKYSSLVMFQVENLFVDPIEV
jgi:hypothetical protein